MPTGIFVPTMKSHAASWSWWVNWFNFVRTQPVVHGNSNQYASRSALVAWIRIASPQTL